jgi:ATP-dependent Clp protease adaptor protein ClpS
MAQVPPDLIEQTITQTDVHTSEPPMFRVVMHNDDFTTKEFVVETLVVIFHKSVDEAIELMWHIHRGGTGTAGIFPREIAETKAAAATESARQHGFPLRLTLKQDGPP